MKTIMIYALLTLLGLNFQSCGGKNKKDKNMANSYAWGPAASAPILFPVELRYMIFYLGEDNTPYPVIYSMLGSGIARGNNQLGMNDFEGQMVMPNSFKTIWLSKAERKVYGGEFTFTKKQKERYRKLFETGYYSAETWEGKTTLEYTTYNTFCMTVIPGGKALLHITGTGRRVYVDSFQCTELKDITLEELNFPYQTTCKTIQEHFDNALKYDKYAPMLEYIKQHGIPYTLWDKYLERFNYKIKIEFENEAAVLDPDYGYKFANGEMFKSRDGISVDSLARIKTTGFTWSVADTVYTGRFFYNEDEVLELFDKAYGKDRGQNGEFVIYVSKYNNWFDISLRVGDREFKFEKTQIHVFKVTPETKDDDDAVFYDNYRGEDPTQFIGE